MAKKAVRNTTTRKPVASGRSPIIPARAVAMTATEASARQAALEATYTPEAAAQAAIEGVQPSTTELSDTVARRRARDLVEIPVNPALQQARVDLEKAVAARAVSNWEVAMIESLIDLRDLQDVIDAMTAKQDVIRENIKLALAQSESKTFKFNLGSATLAKGAETVSITDEKKIPFAFMTTVPDKAKIGRALRVPSDVPGAVLAEGKPSLRVTWE